MTSPDYVRTSMAAAITLGLKPGRFYRNARLGCINLLLDYPSGCRAACAYCGLSTGGTTGRQRFIRVEWPAFKLDELITAMQNRSGRLGRICLSMITHPRAVSDTVYITRKLRRSVDLPVSLLIAPTLVRARDLAEFFDAGADRIGIAVDAATPELFARFRGTGVRGPHRWDKYWRCFDQAVAVFGAMQVGSHLIVGLGETEQEMTGAFLRTRSHGGFTHLFSFYPERGSALADRSPCTMGQYRRMQLARYLIDSEGVSKDAFEFDHQGRLINIHVRAGLIREIMAHGRAFMTSGCPGENGEVACNRPYGNSPPGPDIRNFPFVPDADDMKKIRSELELPVVSAGSPAC